MPLITTILSLFRVPRLQNPKDGTDECFEDHHPKSSKIHIETHEVSSCMKKVPVFRNGTFIL
ncbi:hypothetical protein BDV25DRAFT_153096 [Aspergillus avenaceus]|uniref:Uncharacterized protein n=1 Tax=Aspergillus avenaceus TaxID=36643 RepID=A0A5N6TXW5_ASPAV|nr:hypothetical protein BDV25DRAFT_153096 [Aspergillus avenaceus]